jgi:hypothetical protein
MRVKLLSLPKASSKCLISSEASAPDLGANVSSRVVPFDGKPEVGKRDVVQDQEIDGRDVGIRVGRRQADPGVLPKRRAASIEAAFAAWLTATWRSPARLPSVTL